jgi:hypothetical protein
MRARNYSLRSTLEKNPTILNPTILIPTIPEVVAHPEAIQKRASGKLACHFNPNSSS